jgi:hypothetical protein
MQAVRDAGESCILTTMLALLKRGLALTLPVCLLWLFAACLAVCSLHSEQASSVEIETSFSAHALVSTSEECCSVSDGERSVIPERITYVSFSPKAVRANSISSDFVSHTSYRQGPQLYFPPGPNVKLLGILRI